MYEKQAFTRPEVGREEVGKNSKITWRIRFVRPWEGREKVRTDTHL